MDFEQFRYFFAQTQFDEVKIIAKDLQREGKPYYVIGMARQGTLGKLYILEFGKRLGECEPQQETHRELQKQGLLSENSYFFQIKQFAIGGSVYPVQGGESGGLQQGDNMEAALLFARMAQEGWTLAEESPFYQADWNEVYLTKMEFPVEEEKLPDFDGENDTFEVTWQENPRYTILEIPVRLEMGKTQEIAISFDGGKEEMCYINRVYLMDVWKEQRKHFADPAVREKMLCYATEEELAETERMLYQALAADCPEGMYYPVVEYECSADVQLFFFSENYLNSVPQASNGSALLLGMWASVEQETGAHGLPLRAALIQTPVAPGTTELAAELFYSAERMPEKKEVLF